MAEEPGNLIIQAVNANFDNATILFEQHTNFLSGGAKVITDMSKLKTTVGEQSAGILPQGYMEIYFESDAVDIIESEESAFDIEVEYINPATGAISHTKRIGSADIVGFTGTTDLTYTNAGDKIKVGHFKNDTNMIMRLKPHSLIHVFVGDDT